MSKTVKQEKTIDTKLIAERYARHKSRIMFPAVLHRDGKSGSIFYDTVNAYCEVEKKIWHANKGTEYNLFEQHKAKSPRK